MNSTFKPNRLTSYTNEAIITEIKRVASKYFGGKCPKTTEFNKYGRVKVNTVIRRFGSWPNAMREAGFKYERRIIDTSDLIQDLKKIKNLNEGKYFTQDFYINNAGKYSPETLKKRLGYSTWPRMLEGLLSLKKQTRVIRVPKCNQKPLTEKQLFTELKRVWDALGTRPSYTEFRRQGRFGTKVYERRFGSWRNAIEKFCSKYGYNFQGTKGSFATRKILLAELREIATRSDSDILDFQTYKQCGGTYSIGTFQHHFGKWKNAVEKIGMKDGHRPSTDEELFSEIQRLWEIFGRQPETREMRRDGNISLNVFQRRFGSWMKAIHAFCRDREKWPEEELDVSKSSGRPSKSLKLPEARPIQEKTGESDQMETIIMTTPRFPSPRLRFRVLQRDKFTCIKCGRSPTNEDGVKLHVDHIKPYSKGGETVIENLQTLCEKCNIGKGDIIF